MKAILSRLWRTQPRKLEPSDPEWHALKQFWERREAAIERHRERMGRNQQGLGLPSYQHGPKGRVNCQGSVAIGTGCRTCSACRAEIALLETGPAAHLGRHGGLDNPPTNGAS